MMCFHLCKTRKCQLVYSNRMEIRRLQRSIKKTSEGDGYVHYFDCGHGFTGT